MVIVSNLGFFRVILSSADHRPAPDKNNPEKPRPHKRKTKAKKHQQTQKTQQGPHRNTEATAEEMKNERYHSGLYCLEFHPKRSKFFREECNTNPPVTRQETEFGSHGKIRKTETNNSFTKKRRTQRRGGGRGKKVRGKVGGWAPAARGFAEPSARGPRN